MPATSVSRVAPPDSGGEDIMDGFGSMCLGQTSAIGLVQPASDARKGLRQGSPFSHRSRHRRRDRSFGAHHWNEARAASELTGLRILVATLVVRNAVEFRSANCFSTLHQNVAFFGSPLHGPFPTVRSCDPQAWAVDRLIGAQESSSGVWGDAPFVELGPLPSSPAALPDA
jgi:hypothetical protein